MPDVKTTQQRTYSNYSNYSNDHKLWVGMTRRDAYYDDEISALFDSVDIDKDGVLDQKEINRYNGPIFREKLTVELGSSSGLAVGGTSDGDVAVGVTGGTVTRTAYADYYPGLTLEELDEKHSVETFKQLDIAPADGVLTKDELKKVYVGKKVLFFDPVPITGGIAGGLVGAYIACGAVMDGIFNCVKKINPHVAAILALIGGTAVFAGGIYLGVKGGNAMGDSDEDKERKIKYWEDKFDNSTEKPGVVYEDMLKTRYIKEQ